MLKLPIDERRLYAFAASQGLSGRDQTDEGYILHALLSALFDAAAPKPFSLQRKGQDASLLAYASQPWDAFEKAARLYAAPDVYETVRWEAAASKPMPDNFGQDQCLDFFVRILPMSRAGRQHPTFRPGAEVDVFLLKAEADRAASKPDRETIYENWLNERLARGGAETIAIETVRRRRSVLLRKRADGTRHISTQQPDIDMAGTLIVRDPAAFRACLMRGVGRHRAFGYGMILLKPSNG
ncbi:MAG: type I-E CRISPR-associated protein Cas6/Cse3/CasE [Parvibaculum sp.]|uniref:type I-E CRISPR-associated protein Cas6/Cse3/CasE n=1 Tax=Parvibaculum sp. TaxID=2024848 RepID=UPI003C77BEA5